VSECSSFSRIDNAIGISVGGLAYECGPSKRQDTDTPESRRADSKFQRQTTRSGDYAIRAGQFPIANDVLWQSAREYPKTCPFGMQSIANLAAFTRFDVNTIERRKEPLEILGRLVEGDLYGVFKR